MNFNPKSLLEAASLAVTRRGAWDAECLLFAICQSTRKYYGRAGPAITWNVNPGYRITPAMKLNLYVNNLFNSTGYNHKDPYKLDHEFYNSRLFRPVGREIAAEYVFDF